MDCLDRLYSFDSLDWFCDAEQSCLIILFLGFVWTVCIVSMVYIDSWICSDWFICVPRFDCLNGLYRFDCLHRFLEDLGQS